MIELLAVIVILAIIALIATPIILGIIKDSKEESNKRSIEMYADALKNSIASYQLKGKELTSVKLDTTDGKNFSNAGDFKVDYEGNVVCKIIEVYADGNIYLKDCKVNGETVEYTYGKKASFADDSWRTIAKNVKLGYMYEVGEKKKVTLTGDESISGTYTLRVANNSNPEECKNEDFSQTACGFVVEFEDIITRYKMNTEDTNKGGFPRTLMYKYLQNDIYNSLPQDLQSVIINTTVVSSRGGADKGLPTNFISEDKLYLFSPKEIWGSNPEGNDVSINQTRQLDYYKDVANVTSSSYDGAIKKYNGVNEWWWLRSAHYYYVYRFYVVHDLGLCSYGYYSTITLGVSPAFRIG